MSDLTNHDVPMPDTISGDDILLVDLRTHKEPTPDWTAVRHYLEGTVENEVPESVAERYGVSAFDHEQVAEQMTDQGIEQCPECGTWVESGEIVHDKEWEIIGCEACYVGEIEEE